MKALYIAVTVALLGCSVQPPLKPIRWQDQITIEWKEKQVCKADGKVWSQRADKECLK